MKAKLITAFVFLCFISFLIIGCAKVATTSSSGGSSGGGTAVPDGSPTATTETLAITRMVTNQTITQIDLLKRDGTGQRELIKLVSIDGTSAGLPRGLAWLNNKYLLVSTSNEFFDPWAAAPDGFHQIAIDNSDPTSKSINNTRPTSYTTGTINVDVQLGGVSNVNHSVQIWSRGAAAVASTTGSSATLTNVPVFADGLNWIYAFDANGKEAWQAVPFAGGTAYATVNLSAVAVSPGRISANPTYKTYNYSGVLDKIYSTTVSSTQEVGSSFSTKHCLAISPAANIVYYAEINAASRISKIYSYTIATGATSSLLFDTIASLSGAEIPATFYQFDFSADGTKLYFVAGISGSLLDTIFKLDLTTYTAASIYTQSNSVGYISDLAIDPNGEYVYFVNSTDKNLYKVKNDGTTATNGAVQMTTSGDVGFVSATTQ